MFNNYLKLAFRHFFRQRNFTLLNIIGLSVGLASCLLVLLWVQNERSYNQFHSDADHIYQHKNVVSFGNSTNRRVWSSTPYPYYEILRDDIPEVEQVAIHSYRRTTVFQKDQLTTNEDGYMASGSFFELFNFPLLHGEVNSKSTDPGTVAISATLAKKYFKDNWQQAVGNSIKIDDKDYRIEGVFADVPANSSLQFDYVLPFSVLTNSDPKMANNFGDYNYYIYYRLSPNVNPTIVRDKLRDQVSIRVANTDYSTPEDMLAQPVSEMYLYSKYENGALQSGRIEYVRIFTWAALFLLLLACVNYMNLSTARASRARSEA
ncbi:MAG: ABC transporter permease, partial [Bacteroidota bacterium]